MRSGPSSRGPSLRRAVMRSKNVAIFRPTSAFRPGTAAWISCNGRLQLAFAATSATGKHTLAHASVQSGGSSSRKSGSICSLNVQVACEPGVVLAFCRRVGWPSIPANSRNAGRPCLRGRRVEGGSPARIGGLFAAGSPRRRPSARRSRRTPGAATPSCAGNASPGGNNARSRRASGASTENVRRVHLPRRARGR